MKNIIILLLILLSEILNSQVPKIKWYYNTFDFSAGQAIARDLDNDGKKEIAFSCYRNDSMIYVLNGEDGTLLWKYNTSPTNSHGCNDVAPTVYDVDNNGSLEVILPSSCNPKTYCFNGADGSLKWVTPTKGSDSPPVIADVDNDGKPEILHGEFGGWVMCLNAEDGSIAWELPVDLNSWVQTAPSVVDLDNNGQLDFVVATWNFNNLDSIFAYRGDNQTRLWAFPVHSHIYHGSAISDLDQDDYPEVVIGAYNDTLYCLNGENGTVKWKYKGAGFVGAPAAVADIDSDGSCDLVFVGGSEVTALTNNGAFKWNYTIPNFGTAFRGVALADITNDNYLDVIFGSSKGVLYALNGNDGSSIWNIDLAAHYGNSLFDLGHAPIISDFDNDDTLDVFIAGGYGTTTNIPSNFGRAYLISAGKGKGPDWLMFQHDILRHSAMCNQLVTAVSEFSEIENNLPFPNPSDNQFQFNSNYANSKEAVLCNNLGQVLLKCEKQKSGAFQFQTSLLPDGMYFVKEIGTRAPEQTFKIIIRH